jgi:predicted PurR-regulated permease PerM
MENANTPSSNPNAGRGLGIAGMVLGIVATVMSFIPCIGMGGIVLAVVGVILSAISLNQAGKAGAPRGMAWAGLICSILAIVICILWVMVVGSVAKQAVDAAKMMQDPVMQDSISKAIEDQLKNITDSASQQGQ